METRFSKCLTLVSLYQRSAPLGTLSLVLVLLLAPSLSAAPSGSSLNRYVHEFYNELRIVKDHHTGPLLRDYKDLRGLDEDEATDLDSMARNLYSEEVKHLPDRYAYDDETLWLSLLLRQAHENLGWTVLWMRHVAAQEALHEVGSSFDQEFNSLAEKTQALHLLVGHLAKWVGVDLTWDHHNTLTNTPDFRRTANRHRYHYIQLKHHDMLMHDISERFSPLLGL